MSDIKNNSFRAWILASRPKTLIGAAVPVMIGTTFAYIDSHTQINYIPVLLCFLFAFIMQIDANFINDYFDFIRGNDDETRLGPRRACAQGWISPQTMKKAIIYTTCTGALVGLPLVYFGGFLTIAIGILCIIFAFLYTTKLSYLGLGDFLVLIFFGIIPLTLTYYLAMPSHLPRYSWEVFFTSLLCGIITDNLLIVNNYRDIENDIRAKKYTLVVKIGASCARKMYLVIGIIACLSGSLFLLSNRPWAFLLPFIYLAFHFKTYSKMVKINKGKELNLVLGETARNILIWGISISIGLLLSYYSKLFF